TRHRSRQRRRNRRALLYTQTDVESPPECLRHGLQRTRERDPFRDSAAAAGRFGDGGEPDRGAARLRGRERIHAGIPALEWHDAQPLANDSFAIDRRWHAWNATACTATRHRGLSGQMAELDWAGCQKI